MQLPRVEPFLHGRPFEVRDHADVFIDQDSPAAMYAKAGLDAKAIVATAFEALGQNLQGEAVKLGRG